MIDEEQAVALALEARKKSYSPYSKFAVGAVIVTNDGRVFEGANIENAAYGLSMCAERNAIFNAYMHGCHKEDLALLSVIADTGEPVSPCGSCRQVISELYPADKPIILANLKGEIRKTNAKELLPFAFDDQDL